VYRSNRRYSNYRCIFPYDSLKNIVNLN